MSEEDQKALSEIYNELDDITVRLRLMLERHPMSCLIRNAEILASIAMNLIEIEIS